MVNKMMESLFQDIYEIVKQVPPGRVTTYGAIASYLGTEHSARMVGWVLNQLKYSERNDVPAHRVVNQQGLLSGKVHFITPYAMGEQFQQEGVTIKDNQVYPLEAFFWDPIPLSSPVC
jgi:methylated-DNA-protein-cysteine methyltransferase-like protein